MSKLIEALKSSARTSSEGGATETKTVHQMTQEQLADIYFSGQSERLKKSEYPLIVKVVEKPAMANLIPWIITSIAFLVTAFSLFSTKRVFVDIKIIDEKNPYFQAFSTQESENGIDREGPIDTSWGEGRKEDGQKISTQSIVFEGASKLKSSGDRKGLMLVNSSIAPFAHASLRLSAPLDLSTSKVVFYAKGGRGGENLAFALKDRQNLSAFSKGKIYPFPTALTTGWQRAEITVLDAVKEFDEKNVTSMRFEFGSNIQNKPGDTIFIKDFQIIPA